MENILNQGKLHTFIAPTGYEYTIREQNGGDDDVISNASEARNLTNLSRFIAGIVVKTDSTSTGKLTVEQAHTMPALDKYCILIQSRIHSLGNIVEFSHDWEMEFGGICNYEQDLKEYLLSSYSDEGVSSEEAIRKPNAIPFYPMGKNNKNISIRVDSGKELVFDLMNTEGEAMVLNLPLDKQTKNKDLEARNIRLVEGDKDVKITNWSFFTASEMREIRKKVLSIDPVFRGLLTIENPIHPGMKKDLSIMGITDFFFPGEI